MNTTNPARPLSRIITFVALTIASQLSFASSGLIELPSSYSFAETEQRLLNTLNTKGLTVFTQIKHYEGAKKAGLEINDTQVIIFGNPKVGTPLMQCAPKVAIDLPQKFLIWTDNNDQVWLAYNDPAYLAERHNIKGCEAVLEKISKALMGISKSVVAIKPQL